MPNYYDSEVVDAPPTFRKKSGWRYQPFTKAACFHSAIREAWHPLTPMIWVVLMATTLIHCLATENPTNETVMVTWGYWAASFGFIYTVLAIAIYFIHRHRALKGSPMTKSQIWWKAFGQNLANLRNVIAFVYVAATILYFFIADEPSFGGLIDMYIWESFAWFGIVSLFAHSTYKEVKQTMPWLKL